MHIDIYDKVVKTGVPVSFGSYAALVSKYVRVSVFRPEPGKFAAVYTDITVRVQLEKALKLSEEKFSRVFQASPNIIVISRIIDGLVLDVNEAMIRQSGYSREELVGRRFPELGIWVNLEDRNTLVASIKRGEPPPDQEFNFR